MSKFLNDDKGFFQHGKSFGGKGLFGSGGVLSNLTRGPKKYPPFDEFGRPRCPWTGELLKTEEEKRTGISNEAKSGLFTQATQNQNFNPIPLDANPLDYSSTFQLPKSKFGGIQ